MNLSVIPGKLAKIDSRSKEGVKYVSIFACTFFPQKSGQKKIISEKRLNKNP